MCGLNGAFAPALDNEERSQVIAAAKTLHHRGPDELTVASGPTYQLAHTRLSIIDVAGSHQPMGQRGDMIAFNGEILNYKALRDEIQGPLHTSGDTEVLLQLLREQGPKALDKARGQFAFAWVHGGGRFLTLARDRAGILPLYYRCVGDLLIFGSEVKALHHWMEPPSIDQLSLAEFLVTRSVSAPNTLYRGIHKLCPGEVLTFEVGEHSSPKRLLLRETPRESPTHDDTNIVDQFDVLMRQAVELNMVADVPVGTYLSGGVDSSLISALAARTQPGIHTYSAGFAAPGFEDERRFAQVVAAHVGAKHHEVLLNQSEFFSSLSRLAWQRDAPVSEPADVAVAALARAASEQVRVVLSGEGADELFLGYPKHKVEAIATRIPHSMVAGLAHGLSGAPTRSRRAAIALRALGEPSLLERWLAWFGSFTVVEASQLVGIQRTALLARLGRRLDEIGEGEKSTFGRMLAWDRKTWLADNLLERGDRMTMLASTELRPPFLDQPVVDFARALPAHLLLRKGGKSVVRELASRYLPHTIAHRRKAGFTMPLAKWLNEYKLPDHQQAGVIGSHLDWNLVEKVDCRHRSGDLTVTPKLWAITSAVAWGETAFERLN